MERRPVVLWMDAIFTVEILSIVFFLTFWNTQQTACLFKETKKLLRSGQFLALVCWVSLVRQRSCKPRESLQFTMKYTILGRLHLTPHNNKLDQETQRINSRIIMMTWFIWNILEDIKANLHQQHYHYQFSLSLSYFWNWREFIQRTSRHQIPINFQCFSLICWLSFVMEMEISHLCCRRQLQGQHRHR